MSSSTRFTRTAWQWFSGITFWVYLTALYTATHLPPKQIEGLVTHDKLVHFIAYAGLVFFWLFWRQHFGKLSRNDYIIAFFAMIFFGAFDESTQQFAGRSGDWWDWASDVIGVFLGAILFRFSQPVLNYFLQRD